MKPSAFWRITIVPGLPKTWAKCDANRLKLGCIWLRWLVAFVDEIVCGLIVKAMMRH